MIRSVDETIRLWVKLNGCCAEPVVTEEPDCKDDGTRVERRSYRDGRENTVVELVKIEGGGHTWPGGPPAPAFLGKSTRDIRANDLLWDFFKSHARPAAASP